MSVRERTAALCFGLGFVFGCWDGQDAEPDCQLGTYFCPCFDGMCMAGLVCSQGFCVNPEEDETTGDGDGDSGDGDGDSGDGDGDSGDGDGDGDGDSGDGDGDGDPGSLPTDCADLLASDPGASTGLYLIDLDGDGPTPNTEVLCEMDRAGGGWTLVFTSSDDGVDTWTWDNRAYLGGSPFDFGDPASANLDYMSPTYHELALTDLLFVHQPSDVWAHYGGVGDGSSSLGEIIAAAGSPVCDYNLGGNGYPLSGGTLLAAGLLCDTDLYFSLGDHEQDLNACMDLGSASNSASYGPVWSADKGAGCPFDDPAEFGLGPHGPCGACPNNFPSTEFNYLGYANALGLNTGTPGAGANYMQIYVR
jgi:hypothetical protein